VPEPASGAVVVARIAFTTTPSPDAAATLFRALTASPALQRFLPPPRLQPSGL
jgi:hypothetical protein